MSLLGTHDSRLVNDMISVCHDGKEFYKDAAESVENPSLKALFHEMADIRDNIETDLKGRVEAMDEKPDNSGTVTGKLRTVYTNIITEMSDKPDYRYVEQLEEAEDDALHTFRKATRKIEDPALSLRLMRHVEKIQQTHDRMSHLKHSMKPAQH
jgi:uncharacterized protein (TIGR02284 family)